MIFELINPSDAYTFHAEDVKVAQAVSLLAGGGSFGLTDENGESHSLLVALMGGAEADALLKSTFGYYYDFCTAHREEIADALDSVMPLDIPARRTFDAAIGMIQGPEERRQFREDTEDRERTSLNNIGAYCWAMAKHMRGICDDCAKSQEQEVSDAPTES